MRLDENPHQVEEKSEEKWHSTPVLRLRALEGLRLRKGDDRMLACPPVWVGVCAG